MPNPFETLPDADPYFGFPGGDIFTEDVERADTLLNVINIGDAEEQNSLLKELRDVESGHWKTLPGQDENYEAIVELTEAWADTIPDLGRQKDIGRIGALSTIAFVKRSQMFPVEFCDFSEEFQAMSNYDDEKISFFVYEAWTNMNQVHPLAFEALSPIVRHIADLNELSPDDESAHTLLNASTVLPYIMASTTQLISNLDYSMKNEVPFLK